MDAEMKELALQGVAAALDERQSWTRGIVHAANLSRSSISARVPPVRRWRDGPSRGLKAISVRAGRGHARNAERSVSWADGVMDSRCPGTTGRPSWPIREW